MSRPRLYARQGRQNDLHAYLREHFTDKMIPVLAQEALAAGLLGPGPHAAEITRRLGDVIGLMRPGAALIYPDEKEKMARFVAKHSGLAPDEMNVPWLGFRL